MKPSRKLLAGGLILAACAAPLGDALAQAARAGVCLQPAEQTAFQVRALQSQLMVVAITCGNQDDYNRFVTTNQPDLAAAYRTVANHFRRVGSGQRGTDAFITDLANRQSQVAITQGTLFCRNQVPLFQQVSGLRGQQALAQFSAQAQLPNQYEPPLCGAAQPAAATQAARPQGQQSGQPQQARPQGHQQQPRPQGQPQPAPRPAQPAAAAPAR